METGWLEIFNDGVLVIITTIIGNAFLLALTVESDWKDKAAVTRYIGGILLAFVAPWVSYLLMPRWQRSGSFPIGASNCGLINEQA